MPQLSERMNGFQDSAISRISRLSEAYQAVDLSQGTPDFDPPTELLTRLAEVVQEGPHQYAITFGSQNFREAIARKHGKAVGYEIDAKNEVLATCGGTEAMMCTMMSICNPGDKVLVFSPFYESYGVDAFLCGAEAVYIPLVPPSYKFDINLVEEGFKQGAKAIVICNPSNPCGKVFTTDELTAIGELVVKYDAYAITDEVYEHMVYAPNKHVPMAKLPGLREHVITCNSLSKSYSISGWRLGYLVGPESFITEAKKIHDCLTVGAAAPLQEAAVVALDYGQEYYDRLLDLYTKKRDYFMAGLDKAGIKHNVPEGAYFVMADISEYLALEQFKGYTDVDFCEWMIKNIGVAVVPGSGFFHEEVNHLVRMHFAKHDHTIDAAMERLTKLKELL